MHEYLNILSKMPLFHGIPENKISNVILNLNGYVKDYEKGQVIYDYGSTIDYAGIVLEGEIEVILLNNSGSQHNMQRVLPSGLFGVAYACVPAEKSIVRIVANKKSKVLFLKFNNLYKEFSLLCSYTSRFFVNLLYEIAEKSIYRLKKIEILTHKHIRDRLTLFLQMSGSNDNKYLIPYDRQTLANYLGVERSALSRELSKMKNEGLIDYDRNTITIISSSLFS